MVKDALVCVLDLQVEFLQFPVKFQARGTQAFWVREFFLLDVEVAVAVIGRLKCQLGLHPSLQLGHLTQLPL